MMTPSWGKKLVIGNSWCVLSSTHRSMQNLSLSIQEGIWVQVWKGNKQMEHIYI